MGALADDNFCENFTGGWCPKAKSNIPRSWCFARCDKTKEYPSLIDQGKSFAVESAKYIKAGRPKRTEAEIAKLAAICEKCFYYDPHGKPHLQKEGPRCRQCGCGLDLKQMWETSWCRKGKWPKDDDELKTDDY